MDFAKEIKGLNDRALVTFHEQTISPMLRRMAEAEITRRMSQPRRAAWLDRAGKDLTGAVMA